MSHVSLLDCTLRDGAYLVDKKFGKRTILGIIEGLVKAKIDYIEIGFLQDDGAGEGKTVYKNSRDAQQFIPDDKQGCEFAVLADHSRYSVSGLDERTKNGIDIIRECFFKHERFDAAEDCMEIKKKGYKLFIQPVDILGYTDIELVEFFNIVNEIEPYCLSVVDTFGSMYQEDLHRIFELADHNLAPNIRMGFHSHNNMQMSNALSQEFVRMSAGKREVVIDGTLSGMGRGAGNTPTELIAQYLTAKQEASYDIDALLDIIDSFMDNLRAGCTWGYTTEYFVAGAFSAHVNNITYLSRKNSIRSKDIRFILNKIGRDARKRYDYELLEKTYIEMLDSKIDDSMAKNLLKLTIGSRPVLVLVPGASVNSCLEIIEEYIRQKHPVIISVNFIHAKIQADYIYMSNVRRYQQWHGQEEFRNMKKIMTSNFSKDDFDENTIVVSFLDLVKCGWEAMDNSAVMLLRLLNDIAVKEIALAGFDGYKAGVPSKNYSSGSMEIYSIGESAADRNKEIAEMLADFNKTRRGSDTDIHFITPSRFQDALEQK